MVHTLQQQCDCFIVVYAYLVQGLELEAHDVLIVRDKLWDSCIARGKPHRACMLAYYYQSLSLTNCLMGIQSLPGHGPRCPH